MVKYTYIFDYDWSKPALTSDLILLKNFSFVTLKNLLQRILGCCFQSGIIYILNGGFIL